MNPTVHEYTKGVEMPPDPLEVDLGISHPSGSSVYAVLPFTPAGFSFVVNHQEFGTVDASQDCLLVPTLGIVAFLDRVFDEGLKVV